MAMNVREFTGHARAAGEPAKGCWSQSELPLTFWLGQAARVDAVEITWPGGVGQKMATVKVDALNVVRENKVP